MLYVQLDVNWVDNPKCMDVGIDGMGLHAAALCMAKRMETDGVLHRRHLLRIGGTEELIDRLIDVELLDVVDDRRVRVHGWLDRNPSHGAIAASRTAKSASGREGNHRRWKHPGPVETCEKCNPPEPDFDDAPDYSNSWSSQAATPNGSHSESQNGRTGSQKSLVKSETEIEEETEVRAASNVVDMPRPEVVQLCSLLAERVGTHRDSPPPPVTKRWRKDMRLLLDRGPLDQDKPTPFDEDRVRRTIEFIFGSLAERGENGFCWADQIRSPHALRRHWHKASLSSKKPPGHRRPTGTANEVATSFPTASYS